MGGIARLMSHAWLAAVAVVLVASCSPGQATPDSSPSRPPQLAGRITFVDLPDAKSSFRIYVMSLGTGQRLPVTTPAGVDDDHPRFSPDGTKILFDRAGKIMVVGADGTDLRVITHDCSGVCLGDAAPAWSPGGSRLAFERARFPVQVGPPRSIGIWVADLDGSNPKQITQLTPDSGWEDHYPSFSPDGQQLVFMRDGNHSANQDQASILTIGVDGKNERPVYRLPDVRPGGGGKPRWSPDGTRILCSDACYFESCRPGPPFVPQVFSIRPDGIHLQQLTSATTASAVRAWSPDGKWIVLGRKLAKTLPECNGLGTELYAMRPDGTGIKLIAPSIADGCQPYNPDWGV
jgi:Tol biopolymer transport system component